MSEAHDGPVAQETEAPPPPVRRGGSRGATVWAFLLEMEEGSGRVFGFDDQEERDRFRNNLGSSAHRYGKMHDRKFLVRTLPEKDGQFRCGVWRDFANPDDAPEGWNE